MNDDMDSLKNLIDRLSGNDQRILTPESSMPEPPASEAAPKRKPKYEPRIWRGDEIYNMEFPESAWVVEEIIPAGFTLLAGPPKKGKSWFAMELALAICSDGYFLGRKVTPGKVFYCALEDGQRRFRERQHKQNWTAEAQRNLNVVFSRDFQLLFKNSSTFATFARDAGYSLLIIDTLTRAFHVRDWNDMGAVTHVMGPLQEATSEGVSIIVIDHHRKRGLLTGNDDPISDIIGSTSKGAVADTILGLYKEPGKTGAKLAISGRDIEEQMLDLRFDLTTTSWQIAKPEEVLSDGQRELINIIRSYEGGATLLELSEVTGRNKGTIMRSLEVLAEKNIVYRNGSRWSLQKTIH